MSDFKTKNAPNFDFGVNKI